MKYIALLFILVACAPPMTPITVMQNGNHIVTCGGGTVGSDIGGRLGYSIQKHHDAECVDEYRANGYEVIQK